jgi:hypothetical protein
MSNNLKQEIFTKVSEHLLLQMKKSYTITPPSNSYHCAYRGSDGCKCAIGILISDDVYVPFIEGQSVEHSYVIEDLQKSGISIELLPQDFLYKLQRIHDACEPQFWSEKLSDFAKDFELEIK